MSGRLKFVLGQGAEPRISAICRMSGATEPTGKRVHILYPITDCPMFGDKTMASSLIFAFDILQAAMHPLIHQHGRLAGFHAVRTSHDHKAFLCQEHLGKV
jgi:hypothetical protein